MIFDLEVTLLDHRAAVNTALQAWAQAMCTASTPDFVAAWFAAETGTSRRGAAAR